MSILSAVSYVPWDTSYARGFQSVISTAIGNAVNIGIVVFGILMGIFVVIKVVKHFAKG